MSDFFPWKDHYATGIPSIDSQHRRLVGLINELFLAMKEGKGNDILGKVLNDLAAYTKTHFAHEEKLFAEHRYPKAAVHIREHQGLVQQVADVSKDLAAGKPVLTLRVMNLLKDWLNTHILGSDQAYAPFLRDRGVQ